MRAYALAEIGDREAVDVFLRREDAFAALEDAVRTSPTGPACSPSPRSNSTSVSCPRCVPTRRWRADRTRRTVSELGVRAAFLRERDELGVKWRFDGAAIQAA
jgi:hypothetical protein